MCSYKADLLIEGCIILPIIPNEVITDGAIAINNDRIAFIGRRSQAANFTAEKRINAKGKVALPGLVNCHTHVAMTLFRGLAEDKPLDQWLREDIWPLEAKLKPEDIHAGALLGCLEMIKSGTTCFADMYFHEEAVAKAVKESGLRAVLAEGIIEAGNKLLGEAMLKRSIHFARNFNGYAEGRVTAMLGPHAAYSCSPELLAKVRDKAEKLGVGIHMHLAEAKALFQDLEVKHGCSETEFLDKLGMFEAHVLAAHCIDLSSKDLQILADKGVHVAYVPVSNMKLGLGAAKIKEMLDFKVNVAFGTDGPASNNTLDLFETMKVGALLQKHAYRDPKIMRAQEALRMATINGAKALGLADEIGSLEVGKKADIILIDFSAPHLRPLHDVYAGIVYAAHGSDVDTVIVNGEILMENRQIRLLDEEKIIEEAEEHAFRLLSHSL
ncbi:amidohydrolase [Candidatus Bathyarchaeota archaeon]|nr:amidohydrolase [Candidatus Bathyarchaeota archaeon]